MNLLYSLFYKQEITYGIKFNKLYWQEISFHDELVVCCIHYVWPFSAYTWRLSQNMFCVAYIVNVTENALGFIMTLFKFVSKADDNYALVVEGEKS